MKYVHLISAILDYLYYLLLILLTIYGVPIYKRDMRQVPDRSACRRLPHVEIGYSPRVEGWSIPSFVSRVGHPVIVPDPCRNFLLLPKNIGGDIFHRLFNILYRNLI